MISSGNPTVDEIGRMQLTGIVVPASWLRHLSRTSLGKKHSPKPYVMAVLILADIVHWYCPTRDKLTGAATGKKFRGDKLQCSRRYYADLFGISRRQAGAALNFLAKQKVITLEYRTVVTEYGARVSNVMFIGLDVERLEQITEAEIRKVEDAGYAVRETKITASTISAKRKKVYNKTNGRCAYCGKRLELLGNWHIEHMLPRSRGGQNSMDNLVASCEACNRRKGAKTVGEFRLWLTQKLSHSSVAFYLDQLHIEGIST